MRGRSLIKDPANPSLCAFCAHRLGQARRPSHVQRRFLQSSRPVNKPPAEAAAAREENGNQVPQPSWGKPAGGLGPTASWGRSGVGAGIPPAGPSWGRARGSGTPGVGSSSSPKSVPAREKGSEISSSVASGGSAPQEQHIQSKFTPSEQLHARTKPSTVASAPTQPPPSNTVPIRPNDETDDLEPHERRAREVMFARDAKSQQRPVTQVRGDGPESNRAGRLLPRTESERIQAAQREITRRKAMEYSEANRSHYEGVGQGTASMKLRHTMGDTTWSGIRSSEDVKSKWSHLRTQSESAAAARAVEEDRQRPRSTNFAQERAQREEEASQGRYTPLSSRHQNQREEGARYGRYAQSASRPQDTREDEARYGRRQDGEIPGRASYGLARDRYTGRQVDSSAYMEGSAVLQEVNRQRDPSHQPDPNQKVSFRPMAAIVEQHVTPGYLNNSGYVANDHEKKMIETFEDEEGDNKPKSGREKKKKARKGQSSETSYDMATKGKVRDKAKRREQFTTYDDEADLGAAITLAEEKAQRKRERAEKRAAKAAAPTPILLPEYISVSNLAVALKVRVEDFVYRLQELGFEETGSDHIMNAENAGLIAQEYNYEPIINRGDADDLKAREPAADPSLLPQRPPVVTIMGHVDHGKTTLLDYLRKSSVAATEHGGITQHIGAFSVPMPSGKVITFLDTPGHAAFLSMRQRGANVTDIVILVVAADDSVKPQTIEAINHAKAAKVPIIVAINKIDKEDSNIDRVKQDLARHGVDVEDYGGDTQVVCVSGKTGQGMGELEEAAVTLSEILDMRAEKDGQAEGWVLEASIKPMGKVATVLVRRGTMRPGDFIVAGKTWARIRCLRNEAGVEIKEAAPGTPVEIDGWRDQPLAGDEVLQASDEAKAKTVVEYRLEKEERDKMAEDMEAINENRKVEQEKREREKVEAAALEAAIQAQEEAPETLKDEKPTGPKQVYFIIKGDVSGSVEAVIDQISILGNKEVQPHILRYGVGQLSEFDIEHAASAKGLLINFNTAVDPHIASLAEKAKVTILNHNIIYRLVDDIKAEMSKHLPPLITQRVLGEAEIAQIFEINVKGRQYKSVAGCKVRNGTIAKLAKVRVMRKGEKVYDGTLASLKNVKKEAQEMKKGSECGMGFNNWSDFKVGDQIQSYEEKEEKRYL
ncbi:related to translation initiation factor IF-2, mitochondrial [Rhynchosporium agropyri]|uniref:Translation initiation factor IF-2, mitochondrial n=1 Tax=Rhynchosporium agropyri TaxID=914238 RepID=A0A1E1KAX0_9HELO|nr:related to translation initiation factor IF-2, mitochondrial [Rhynchosporium agropyri]